ncbi:MAG: pimeloyl-CoA synthetase [Acidimicrobiales bacterium]|jgi:acyl-CoA synthetase (NDP forming)|nr:pimeloyl-CoA synthetase [Acidimicrobiales bacterium]
MAHGRVTNLTRVSENAKGSPLPTKPKLDVTGRPVALRPIDLDGFFHPRAVAVIGASDTPNKPNAAMYRKIKAWAEHHGATVIPVNPNKDSIDGDRCYPSILDVPIDVDLACILVGDAVEVLPEVIDKKARFAVVFAAGFAETGTEGAAKQAALERLIADSDIHVLGPNTNLNAFELFRDDLDGPAIALITQSGHQGRPIFQGQELGIRLSHWAPTGNEADLESADFMGYFAGQPEVGAIACYIEGFKDGRSLMLAADAAARAGVPVTCVKVGRTDEGRSMAKAHTGHLTGSDAVTSAVFRQFGITRVDGLDELLDTAAMFARTKPPAEARTGGVVVYSISGGTGAHMADLCAAAGLHLPQLTAGTQTQLHEWIPPYLRVSNPVDNGGAPSADWRGRKILDVILADPNCDMLICPITGALPSMGNRLAKDIVEASKTTEKPVFVVWGSPVGNEDTYTDILLPGRIPVFRTFANAVGAAKAYFDYHAFRHRYRSPFETPVLRPSPAAAKARAAGIAPDELSSMAVLRAYGIPVPNHVLATRGTRAVAAAEEIGFPVVLKACGAELLHKSDLGLVKVGLTSAKQVRAAFDELVEKAPGADGVIVSELIGDGVECVVGMTHDELFGPVVMVGLGGVFVEVLHDVAFRVPPFDKAEARRMVEELKGLPLLLGARGRPKADVGALVDVIMKVQRLAVDLSADVAELDINPLVVRPKGAVALDALIVPKE